MSSSKLRKQKFIWEAWGFLQSSCIFFSHKTTCHWQGIPLKDCVLRVYYFRSHYYKVLFSLLKLKSWPVYHQFSAVRQFPYYSMLAQKTESSKTNFSLNCRPRIFILHNLCFLIYSVWIPKDFWNCLLSASKEMMGIALQSLLCLLSILLACSAWKESLEQNHTILCKRVGTACYWRGLSVTLDIESGKVSTLCRI